MTLKKFKNLTDQGRSMTEMLGVLAIIGILSLAALIGYRFAVDKYLANDTLDEVNSRAVVATTQLSRGLNILGQDEFNSSTRHGYPVETNFLADTEGFYIQLDTVPKGVCKQLATSNYIHSISINNVADTLDANLCIESNTVRFTFETDADRCNTDADCACGGTCEEGRCISNCPSGTACTTDFLTGTKVCCPYNKLANGVCCNTINEDGLCCDDKGSCCPADKPLINRYGDCFSCEGEQSINVTNHEETCGRCPNRFLSYDFNAGGMYWCAKWCPSGQVPDITGQCHTCDETTLYKVAKSGVKPQSVGGEQAALACPMTLLRLWGDHDISVMNCLSQDQSISVTGYPQTCEKCDNRVLNYGGYSGAWNCVKKCPDDKPIMDTTNTCHSCDDYGYYALISLNEAAVRACPKTLMRRQDGIIAEIYHCDQPDLSIPVSDFTDMCLKCTNRRLDGDECVLK